MATNKGFQSPMKKNNQYNDDNTKCQICKKNFIDPRQLPCSHIYCFRCICDKVSYKYKNFMCPKKDGTIIQQNEIDSLPSILNSPQMTEDNSEDDETVSNSDADSITSESSIDAQNTIFISGLPVHMHLEQLKQSLANLFGTIGQIKFNQKINKLVIYVFKDESNKKTLKGTATITFEDEDSVEKAIQRYNGKHVQFLNGSIIHVDKWKPKSTLTSTTIKQTHAIIIDGIPTSMSIFKLLQALTNTFNQIGQIKMNPKNNRPSIDLHTDINDSKKLTGRGKITFENEQSVDNAIQTYDGQCIPLLDNSKIFIQKFDISSKQNFVPKVKFQPKQPHPQLPKPQPEITLPPSQEQKPPTVFTKPSPEIPKPPTVFPKSTTIFQKPSPEAPKPPTVFQKPSPEAPKPPIVFPKPPPVIPKPSSKVFEPATVLPQASSGIKVWTLREGYVATKCYMKRTDDVDDLKRVGFAGKDIDSNLYQAFYRNRELNPGETIPNDTTSTEPVMFKKLHTPVSVATPVTNINTSGSSSENRTHVPKHFHILVDNSNIFIAAQMVPSEDNPKETIYNPAIRINVKKLVGVIERTGKLKIEIKTRVVGGSVKANNNTNSIPFEEEWRTCSYRTMFVQRIGKEPQVDNALHSEGFKILLQNDNSGQVQQVLVLLTGDGNDNEDQTNFPHVVETALTKNWHIEIWSWKTSLHSYYSHLQNRFPKQMKIFYLDQFRNEITYIAKDNKSIVHEDKQSNKQN